MPDRDLYTADGREWWEPGPEDLIETTEELRTMEMHTRCRVCDEVYPPQTMRVLFVRERTWRRIGGISYEFSEWGPWRVVGFECLNHKRSFPF